MTIVPLCRFAATFIREHPAFIREHPADHDPVG